MGFRDAIDAVLGSPRLPKASLEKLFAISAAGVTMETGFGTEPFPAAGVCFKPMESARYEAARVEIDGLLRLSSQESGTRYRIETDEYRFTWVVLEDPDFEDLIAGIHMVSQTFIEKGFGEYLLCAIFRFGKDRPLYWIFSFKQGKFYPFVPAGSRTRDSSTEFRLRSLLQRELPVQEDPEKWYPLWGIPV